MIPIMITATNMSEIQNGMDKNQEMIIEIMNIINKPNTNANGQ